MRQKTKRLNRVGGGNLGELYSWLKCSLSLIPHICAPEEKAGIILEIVLGKDRADVILNATEPVDDGKLKRIRNIIEQAKQGKPLAYAIGEWFFAGRKFLVTSKTMIPRPDSEVLYEVCRWCIEQTYSTNTNARVSVLEIGTGCGALIISLCLDFPNVMALATDISADALAVAKENAKRYGARIEFRRGNLFKPLDQHRKFELIFSNPPYVDDRFEVEPEVRKYEPAQALFVPEGKAGTYYHELIIVEGRKWLKDGGFLALEVGLGQADEVEKIMHRCGYTCVQRRKDLGGIERVIFGRWRKS